MTVTRICGAGLAAAMSAVQLSSPPAGMNSARAPGRSRARSAILDEPGSLSHW
jgi:hypothetical protein